MSDGGEFARGGRILAASFVGIAIGISSLYFYSLGIFIKPLAAAFGWSRGEASLGALVGTGCAALASFPTGWLIDRFGSVRIALGSLMLLSLGFAALGVVTDGLASFLAIVAVLSLLTAGSSPMSFTRLVVATFERRRGVALGIVLSGTGMGAIAIPALLAPYVATHGWRAGYLALAAIIPLALPLIWLLLRGAREPLAAPATPNPLRDVVAYPAFRLLGPVFLLASVAVLGTIVHFVPMLADAGFTPAQAGGTTALIGVSAIGGRLLAGALLDRFAAGWVTAGLFLFVALGLLMLALGGLAFAVPGALTVGLAIGAEVDLIAFLTGRYFPRPIYGQAYGALYALYLLGGAIGPALSGYLFDMTGDYRLSLTIASGLLAIASVLATRMGKLLPASEQAVGSTT